MTQRKAITVDTLSVAILSRACLRFVSATETPSRRRLDAATILSLWWQQE